MQTAPIAKAPSQCPYAGALQFPALFLAAKIWVLYVFGQYKGIAPVSLHLEINPTLRVACFSMHARSGSELSIA